MFDCYTVKGRSIQRVYATVYGELVAIVSHNLLLQRNYITHPGFSLYNVD